MAIIGQQLSQPGSGWKRVKIITPFVTTSGSWLTTTSRLDNFTDGITMFTTTMNSALSFEFTGTKIRLMAERQSAYDTDGEIEIDGVKSSFSCYDASATYTGKVLVFEKTGLENTKHTVIIRKITNDAKAINVDSIDIASSRSVFKNKEDKYYSLSDRTLVHLPNGTSETIVKHGVDSGETILLDTSFVKHQYPIESTSKFFTQDIITGNSLRIKESPAKPWTSLLVWRETNMTSDTTPTPLVANAQGSNRTDYLPWKAFNGTIANVNDCWISGSEGVNSWIQIKYEKPYKMITVEISPRNETDFNTSSPRDFDILGSNNGVDFDTLTQIRGQNSWQRRVSKRFAIPNNKEYSIYRIKTISTNGSLNVAIGDIIFGYKREVN